MQKKYGPLFAVAVLVVATVLGSCGGDESGSSSVGSINIVMMSSDITREKANRDGRSCTVTYTRTDVTGSCYTPLSIKGIFNQANLGSTLGGDPIRLLGGGSLTGLEAVFHHSEFDLAASPTIEGEDTFEEATGSYNLISLNLQAIEYKFLAGAAGEYFHVRVPFVYPKPSDDSTFTGCGWGGGIDEADTYGTFWDGFAAQPRDILVCVKATADETCTDADYQWVNTDALTSIRPGSPKQVANGAELMTASTCSRATWGYTSLDVGLSSAVAATAEFVEGTKIYTVGSDTGTVLTATIDFDITNSLFLPNGVIAGNNLNGGSVSRTNVLAAIDQILPKPLYVNSVKTSPASTGDGMFSATASLSVE